MSVQGHLTLTHLALREIQDIYDFSASKWGDKTASKYVEDLNTAIKRIEINPELLIPLPDLHPALRFYRVNKHLLACDVKANSIVLLTVLHTSRDIPEKLAALQPILAVEIDLLHQSLRATKRPES